MCVTISCSNKLLVNIDYKDLKLNNFSSHHNLPFPEELYYIL